MSDELARRFHEAYERLAPQFGYETRAKTRAFDPESPNGKLMIAVCKELSTQPAADLLQSCRGSVKAELMRYEQMILSCNRGSRPVLEAEANRLRALLDAIDGTQPAAPIDFLPGELELMTERGRKAWAGVELVDGHIAEPSAPLPAVPEGWKLVPIEPTLEMVTAAIATGSRNSKAGYWSAMLAAAPSHLAAYAGGGVQVPLTMAKIKCTDYRGTLDEHIRAVRMTEAAHGIVEPARDDVLATGQMKERWAVFCDTCGKRWSVDYRHEGRYRCKSCATGITEGGGK